MSDTTRPRCAPWGGPDGQPAYLVSEEDGMLSRPADAREDDMLNTSRLVLEWALGAIDDEPAALRFVAEQLAASLAAALTVAELRGQRL